MRAIFIWLFFALTASAAEPVEPIPAGALQRLGTTAFRADRYFEQAFYSKDDRHIVACSVNGIMVWDAETGRLVQSIDPTKAGEPAKSYIQQSGFKCYDALGHRIAGLGIGKNGLELQYWDLATGSKISVQDSPRLFGPMEFAPDGRLVGSVRDSKNRAAIEIRNPKGAVVGEWAFANTERRDSNGEFCILDDHRLLSTAGADGPAIYDLATGKELVRLRDAARSNRCEYAAASRDGRWIAIASPAACEIFESATGRKVIAIPGDEESPGLALAFSPDGKTIYFHTEKAQAFDAATGKPRFAVHLDQTTGGRVVAVSHDGRRLAIRHGGLSILFQVDAATGRQIAPAAGHDGNPRIVWLPDGRRLLARCSWENSWALWNVASGRCDRSLDSIYTTSFLMPGAAPVYTSPDNREVIDFGRNHFAENTATVFELPTGKIVRRLFEPDHAVHSQSPLHYDGPNRRLLTGDYDRTDRSDRPRGFQSYWWWNLATDRREATFRLELYDDDSDRMAGNYIAVVPFVRGTSDSVYGPSNPNPYRFAIRLHRASDGKLFRVLDHVNLHPQSIVPAADDELMLVESWERREPAAKNAFRWHLWEVASGREIARWDQKPVITDYTDEPAAPAPNGNYIARGTEPDRFAIYEPYLLKRTVAEIPVPAEVESFSFSPDGRRLATVLKDTTIVIWDTAPWEKLIADQLRAMLPGDLKPLVEALADEPAKANAAVRLLGVAGERAIPLLKEKITFGKPTDPALFRRLIADLDAPRFAVRERASKDLAALGERAEPAMKAALEAKPTAEVKSRLEKLIGDLAVPVYDAKTLGELRAVRVLAGIGTPAARELLSAWARGDEAAPLTRAAKKALGNP